MKNHDENPVEWLIVGRVGKPHGVHGTVLATIISDFPERLTADLKVGLGPETGPKEFVDTYAVRMHRDQWLLDFKDIRNRERVEEWRGLFLFLPEMSLDELPDGFFYEHHLVGLLCVSADGREFGEITGLDDGPGQTRALLRRGRHEFLVPWVPEIVKEVDLENRRVVLDPPNGLLDDDFVTG